MRIIHSIRIPAVLRDVCKLRKLIIRSRESLLSFNRAVFTECFKRYLSAAKAYKSTHRTVGEIASVHCADKILIMIPGVIESGRLFMSKQCKVGAQRIKRATVFIALAGHE